jgi:hypothetical protein
VGAVRIDFPDAVEAGGQPDVITIPMAAYVAQPSPLPRPREVGGAFGYPTNWMESLCISIEGRTTMGTAYLVVS